MYQSLIWLGILGDVPGRLRAALNAEDRKRLANALVDSVRRNSQFGRDLLRIEVLVDQQKAIQMVLVQARDALRDWIRRGVFRRRPIIIRQAVHVVQSNPHLAQHGATPEQRVSRRPYAIGDDIAIISSVFPPIRMKRG
jgi:hypothetical protein